MTDTTKKISSLPEGTKVIQTAHPFEGLPNADERLAKTKIAYEINEHIQKKKLTQKAAAELLNITQPEILNLKRGRLSGFTFDRLYRCLNALNVDVQIIIKKHPSRSKKPAGVHITAA